MEKMDSFLQAPPQRQVIPFKGVWNRNCQEAAPHGFSSTWTFKLHEKNLTHSIWGKTEKLRYLYVFGMFCRSIQAETPLCTLLGILHYCAWLLLHQASTNTLLCSFTSTQFHLWELLMLLGKIKDLDPHTPTTFTVPLQSVSILCPPYCACCRHSASTLLPHVKTAFAWKKTTFLSSILKGINRLKNYCRKKTILAFKMWWQPTNGQEIKY